MPRTKKKTYVSEDVALAGIGEAYFHGIGMPVDFHNAYRFTSKAAQLGNVAAMSRLGDLYAYGYGVEKDLTKALTWYENAAEKGDIRALCALGDYYRDGTNHLVGKDPLQASHYYLKALDRAQKYGDLWNVPDVYLRMAQCLFQGIGVEKNLKSAYEFYCSAADGFLDRMENGDRYCEEALDQAEAGVHACEVALGFPNSDTCMGKPS